MSGLMAALNATATSLNANQTTIEVIGNNISNMNTAGYSLQNVQLTPFPALTMGSFFIGQGVKVSDIQRAHDNFVTNQLQNASVGLGYANGQTSALNQLEGVFSVSGSNISTNINNFFDSWQQLSTDPSDLTLRNAVIQQGGILATSFNNASNALDTITGNINTTLTSDISDLNSKISQIASLNDQIYTTEIHGQTNNSARDQRDLLAQQLAQSLGVNTYTDNRGMLAVQLPGGLPLVQGTTAMSLQTTSTGSNVTLQLNAAGTVRNLSVNTVGGEIQGLLAIRDQTIPAAKNSLDTLANAIATQVNAQQSAGGGLDNSTGVNFFNTQATSTDAARNMKVTLTDPNQVAAGAAPTATSTVAPGDNSNALTIGNLGSSFLINGTDTFNSYYANISATIGLATNQNALAVSGAQDAVNQLQNLRDSIAGVSLQDQMVQMIQYQQGFQASAKFLSTVNDMMNSLISSVAS
ncbi:MAG: flagellar hook-associated protein FlgK [Desulfocapsaceae bacterium]|nr:flagellar hook-associated protein FlgK [Desulfocapsaceae bacterium]